MRIDLARAEDAEAIARLLARPLPGLVRIARAAHDDAPRRHAVVARDAAGAVVGYGARSVRRAWLGGHQRLIGYLHGLRRDERAAGAGRALAAGLGRLAETRRDDEADHDLTAIMSDNAVARRVLERLPGAPRYHAIGAFRTAVFAARAAARWTARGVRCAPCRAQDVAAAQALVDRRARDYAPIADVAADASEWWLAWRDARLVGAARVVAPRDDGRVVGYAPRLARVRPVANAIARLTRRPTLPPAGAALGLAYAAHLSAEDDDGAIARALAAACARRALERGRARIVVGFGARHPLADAFARAPAWRAESVLYAVGGEPPSGVEASPEAAWL